MKKITFIGLLFAIMALIPAQNALAQYCTFSGNSTHAERRLQSFTLTDGVTDAAVQNVQPALRSAVYKDMTSVVFETSPGATISFKALDWKGGWMHGYVYIDYNDDKEFNQTLNNGTNGGELVSYSFYSPSDASTGENSNGTTIGHNPGINETTMPSWTIPADQPAGYYRLRFKIDWNNLNPCGNTTSTNNTATNGGCLCDITIRVVTPTPSREITVRSANPEWGTVSGGGTAEGPITITATPNEGYKFLNWTVEEVIVSSKNPYEDRTEGDKTYIANFAEKDATDTYNETVCKPTFAARGNSTYVSAATISNGNGVEDGTVDLTSVGTDTNNGVTSPITAVSGATVDLNLTFALNWGDIYIYSITNGDSENASCIYGPYEGSWVSGGSTATVMTNMANAGIVVDGTTATFPVTVPSELAEGDIYVVRVASGDVTSVCASSVAEGTYLDFLFEIAGTSERTVTVQSANPEWGTVSGGGTASGAIEIAATPAAGYRFVNWTVEGGETITENPYTDFSEADITYTANFEEIPTYAVSVSASDASMGTASSTETGEVFENTSITLTAIPASGYTFVNWTKNGTVVSTDNPYMTRITENSDYVANFCKILDRSAWSATASSEKDPEGASGDGPASYAINNASNGWWHTNYGVSPIPTVPHWIQFDLGSVQAFDAFNYVSRTGSTTGCNGNVKTYSLYVSNSDISADLGSSYVPNNATLVVDGGTFTYSGDKNHIVKLDQMYSGQYVYMLITDTYNDSQDAKFANCDEFYLYQYGAPPFKVTVSSSDEAKGIAYIGAKGTTEAECESDGTETVTLTAEAAEGYEFVYWTLDGVVVSTDAVYTTTAVTEDRAYVANFTNIASSISIKGTPNSEVTLTITTDAPCTVTANGETVTTTDGNLTQTLTTTIPLSGELRVIPTGVITTVSLPESVTEIELRNTGTETEVNSLGLKKLTVVADELHNAAQVSAASILTDVQVYLEKDITVPYSIDGVSGKTTYFNFISLPFAINTAEIEYWNATTSAWEEATLNTIIRVYEYDAEKRAAKEYNNTWTLLSANKTIAANQGFALVGNASRAYDGTKMKVRFTSAAAYSQNGAKTITPATTDATFWGDKNWNFSGTPYMTGAEKLSGLTLYFHDGFKFVSTTPSSRNITSIKPYQGYMFQSEDANPIEVSPLVSVANELNAADGVYCRATITINGGAGVELILSDNSSEEFVVNEDAWYMTPTVNKFSTISLKVLGNEASVSVQPQATELPLTVYAGSSTEQTISLSSFAGEGAIYLKDSATGNTVCLNDEDYTFTVTPQTTVAGRFTISMVAPTGIEQYATEGDVKVIITGDDINVYGAESGTEVTAYTTNGVVLSTAVAGEEVTTLTTAANGVIIVKVADTAIKVVK